MIVNKTQTVFVSGSLSVTELSDFARAHVKGLEGDIEKIKADIFVQLKEHILLKDLYLQSKKNDGKISILNSGEYFVLKFLLLDIKMHLHKFV